MKRIIQITMTNEDDIPILKRAIKLQTENLNRTIPIKHKIHNSNGTGPWVLEFECNPSCEIMDDYYDYIFWLGQIFGRLDYKREIIAYAKIQNCR